MSEDEGTEPAEDEEVTASAMPEFDTEPVEISDDVTISASVSERTFPEGTKMDAGLDDGNYDDYAEVVAAEFGDQASIVALSDVSFIYNEEIIQPAEGKTVTITVTYKGEKNADSTYKVFHLAKDADDTYYVAESADLTETEVKLEVSSLSPIGVAEIAPDEQKRGDTKAGDGEEPEMITVTFDPTTDPAEPQSPDEIEVASGNAIDSLIPDVPEEPGYVTTWVVQGTDTEVTADTIVTESFTAVVKIGEKIAYTVTFVQEDHHLHLRSHSGGCKCRQDRQ